MITPSDFFDGCDGTYPTEFAAFSIRRDNSSLTTLCREKYLETVAGDTFASCATSRIVPAISPHPSVVFSLICCICFDFLYFMCNIFCFLFLFSVFSLYIRLPPLSILFHVFHRFFNCFTTSFHRTLFILLRPFFPVAHSNSLRYNKRQQWKGALPWKKTSKKSKICR